MAETIKGINVFIGADTTGLSAALSDVNKRARDIQSELKQVDRLLKLDPSNTELLAQKQKLLGDAIANTREKLDRLKSVQEQVNEQFQRGEISEGQYRAFQREVAKTEQELQKLEQQLKAATPAAEAFGKKLEETGEKLKGVGEKMSDVGKKLSVGVTAPLVGLGTVATKAAIDFESAFAGVRKTVDATEEEFAQLEQGIRDMSKRMPAAATDIAAVAEAAGQLGIETPNILEFTEVMIGLGEATNLTAEEGATQFARFANIVGMSQQDFDRLGSAVVALGNNFATTEAEIVAMGMRLAGQGVQIGLTEAQIMALAAAMSSVGIEAEAGGTAMSMVLKKMQIAVDEAGNDLENFAKVARMSADEFAEAFRKDPAAALQAFVDGLAASSSEGANLTMILNELGISGIRESDTLLRLAGASDVLRGAIETATDAWEENSALQNEVAQRYATTESQFAMFKNKLQDVAVTLGQALIPALMDALAAAQPLIDMIADGASWFAGLDEGAQKAILGFVGLVAAVGPLLMVLGPIVSGIGSLVTTIGTMIPAIAGASAATGGFAAVMTAITGPIGIAVAVIAGLAAAAFLIIKNWEPIKEFFVNLWEGIKSATATAWEAIKSGLSSAWEAISNTASSIFEGISTFLTGLWEGITLFLTETWNGLSSAAETAFTEVVDVIQPIMDGLKTFFTGIWDAIKNIFAGALLLIIDLVMGDFENLSKDAQGIWNNLKEAFSNIWDGIKHVFSEYLVIIKNGVTEAWNWIKSATEIAWNNIKSSIETAWDGIKSAITTIATTTVTWIKDTWNGLLNWFRELPGKLYQIGSDMFNQMYNAITSTIPRVKEAIVTGVSEAIDWLRGLPSTLYNIGKDIIQGLVNGIKSMVGKVGEAVGSVADKVTGGLRNVLGIRSPSRLMMKYGAYISEGLAQGILATQDLVKNASEQLASLTITPMQSSAGTSSTATSSQMVNQNGPLLVIENLHVRNDQDLQSIQQMMRQLYTEQTRLVRAKGARA